MKLLMILFGITLLLASCDDPAEQERKQQKQKKERERKQQEQAKLQTIKEEEKVKFSNIGACLKAKKETTGVEMPTAEMIRECKNSVTP